MGRLVSAASSCQGNKVMITWLHSKLIYRIWYWVSTQLSCLANFRFVYLRSWVSKKLGLYLRFWLLSVRAAVFQSYNCVLQFGTGKEYRPTLLSLSPCSFVPDPLSPVSFYVLQTLSSFPRVSVSIVLALGPSVPLSLGPSVPQSLCPSVPLSLCPSVPLSLGPSVPLSLCPSVHILLCIKVSSCVTYLVYSGVHFHLFLETCPPFSRTVKCIVSSAI